MLSFIPPASFSAFEAFQALPFSSTRLFCFLNHFSFATQAKHIFPCSLVHILVGGRAKSFFICREGGSGAGAKIERVSHTFLILSPETNNSLLSMSCNAHPYTPSPPKKIYIGKQTTTPSIYRQWSHFLFLSILRRDVVGLMPRSLDFQQGELCHPAITQQPVHIHAQVSAIQLWVGAGGIALHEYIAPNSSSSKHGNAGVGGVVTGSCSTLGRED